MQQVVHTPAVRTALSTLRSDRQRVLDAASAMMQAADSAMFELDLIAVLAFKRAIAGLAGFTSLIEQGNMTCARPLLRVQIDNVLRFYAFSLVDDPYEMARKVMAGTQIRTIKDRQGHALTDAHLVSQLKRDIPWLTTVYGKTSGFIHLSRELVAFTVTDWTDETGEFQVTVTELDHLPERVWLESIACFREATELFVHIVGTWTQAKGAGLRLQDRVSAASR